MSSRLRAFWTALVAAALLFTGCESDADIKENDTSETNSSDEAASAFFTEKEKNNDNSENVKLEKARKTVTDFMNALKCHDMNSLMMYGGAQSFTAYDFLNSVVLDSWEISDVISYEDDGISRSNDRMFTFNIKMNILESKSDLFSVGESVWSLSTVDSDCSYFDAFRPVDCPLQNILADSVDELEQSEAVKLCYAFTSELGWLYNNESCSDFSVKPDALDRQVEKELFVNNMIDFCRCFNEDENAVTDGYFYSVDWLEKSSESLLSVKHFDFTDVSSYNKDNNSVPLTESKNSCAYGVLTDEIFDSDYQQYLITIDWYADTIFLSKAATLQYTVKQNENDTLTLVSVESLYSTDEKIACFYK